MNSLSNRKGVTVIYVYSMLSAQQEKMKKKKKKRKKKEKKIMEKHGKVKLRLS